MKETPPILKCKACGKTACSIPLKLVDGAILGGYPCVQWLDPDCELPEDEHWRPSEKAPEIGEERIVFISHPAHFSTDDGTWFTYQPPYSTLDGWLDHPSELPISGLVLCQFKRSLRNDGNKAWVRVLVKDYVALRTLVDEPAKSGPLPLKFFKPKPFISTFAEWSFYRWSAQGDLCEWAVFFHGSDGPRLLLYGEWGFDYDSFCLLNRRLPQEEYDALVAKSRTYTP